MTCMILIVWDCIFTMLSYNWVSPPYFRTEIGSITCSVCFCCIELNTYFFVVSPPLDPRHEGSFPRAGSNSLPARGALPVGKCFDDSFLASSELCTISTVSPFVGIKGVRTYVLDVNFLQFGFWSALKNLCFYCMKLYTTRYFLCSICLVREALRKTQTT